METKPGYRRHFAAASQTPHHWECEEMQTSFAFQPKCRSFVIPALIKSIYLHPAMTVLLQDFLRVVISVE